MKRDPVLDYAKGIVIILMVVGHCYSKENFLLNLIYGFHMPFFFVISGLIYGNKSQNENYRFSYKKVGTELMIPYYFYELIFAIFLAAIAFLSRSETMLSDFLGRIKRMLTLKGITVTWYLACIAFVEIVFMFLYSRKRKYVYVEGLAAIFLIGGLIAAPYIHSGGATILARVAVGIGFFGFGFAVGKSNLLCKCQQYRLGFVLPIAVVVYGFAVYANGMVSIVSLKIGNPFLYVINGLLGTGIILILANVLNRIVGAAHLKAVLTRFGQNTLFILGTHMLLVEIIRIFDYQLFRNLLPKFGIGEGIIFGTIVCTIDYLMIPLYHKVKARLISSKT